MGNETLLKTRYFKAEYLYILFSIFFKTGSQIINDPLMLLSFLSLPVIPSLKLTDKGLVDVENFK